MLCGRALHSVGAQISAVLCPVVYHATLLHILYPRPSGGSKTRTPKTRTPNRGSQEKITGVCGRICSLDLPIVWHCTLDTPTYCRYEADYRGQKAATSTTLVLAAPSKFGSPDYHAYYPTLPLYYELRSTMYYILCAIYYTHIPHIPCNVKVSIYH